MNLSLVRPFLCLALAATAGLAALPAQALSTSKYSIANGGITALLPRQTATRLRIEGKDNAGALVGIRYCQAGSTCASTVNGAVNNVVVLEYDPNREEVLTEKCRGVVSTIPQLRCENGDYEVTLRVRIAEMVLKPKGDSLLGSSVGRTDFRFEFRDDATKHWYVGDTRYDGTSVRRFPAGRYKMFAPDLEKHCKPKHLDPGIDVDLPEGVRTTVEVRYGATECTVLFTTDVDVGGLTMTSDRGPVTCEARRQVGIPSVKSVCTGVFPFNRQVTVSATVPAGLEPYFASIGNQCDRTPVTTQCRFTPKSDSDLTIFTDIEMRARAAGAAPPPLAVGLAVALSTSAPSAGSAAKGEAGVPMLQLAATAQNGTAMLQALTVKASGSGRDDLDLMMVKVVVDANGNGVFDAGETVLAQGRPSADNGELRLGFGSAIAVSATTGLLVVADIGSDVHSASAATLGGATLVLAFGLVAMPATRRRRLFPAALAAVMALALVQGCGGGNEGAAEPAAIGVPPVVAQPPAPVLLTYQLDLVAVEATDTATPVAPLTVRALPVAGTTVTVPQ